MISHPNSATPTGGFLDLPAARDSFEHSAHRDHRSGLWRSSQSHSKKERLSSFNFSINDLFRGGYVSLGTFHKNIESCESRRGTDSRTGFLHMHLIVRLSPSPRSRGPVYNAIPLIIVAMEGRLGENIISLGQLRTDRMGNGHSRLYLATNFPALLTLPAH
jgi:hypothetical protein